MSWDHLLLCFVGMYSFMLSWILIWLFFYKWTNRFCPNLLLITLALCCNDLQGKIDICQLFAITVELLMNNTPYTVHSLIHQHHVSRQDNVIQAMVMQKAADQRCILNLKQTWILQNECNSRESYLQVHSKINCTSTCTWHHMLRRSFSTSL